MPAAQLPLQKSLKSARHRVRDQIEKMILSGTLRPGEKLLQQPLAKQFGVALGVLRESLLELKACGLVEVVDNLGMFVANLDGKRVLEALEIREIHEGLAARLCCRRASRENIHELRQWIDEIDVLARAGNKEEAGKLDRNFHLRIVQLSGNETLGRLAETFPILSLVLSMSSDVEVVRQAHLEILSAIEHNRPDDAERLMREHIRSARNVIEQRIREGTFLLEWIK